MINVTTPVLLDLNTQRDMFAPDGVFPVCEYSRFLDPLKKIFNAAHRLHIPVISTRLYNQVIVGQRGTPTRLVCHPQTPGYQKLGFTQLRRRMEMPTDCGTSLPVEGFHRIQQYIFDLPSMNLFECPRLDRLLSESTVAEYIIFGAPLEWTVRTAVLGLLQRRIKVSLVSTCVAQWDPYEGDMALRQIESKNVEWLTTEQTIERLSAQPKRPRLVERRPASAPVSKAQLNTPHAPPAAPSPRAAKERSKSPAGKFRA